MRWNLCSAACVALLFGAPAFIEQAKAATVSILSSDPSSTTSGASMSFNPTPDATSGSYGVSSGNSPNQASSPFTNTSLLYTVLSFGSAGFGSATYDTTTAPVTFSFLWGSPDAFNTVSFLNGSTVVGSYTGTTIGDPFTGQGFDAITFSISGITSVVFSNSGQAAFEYADVDPVPLPATAYMLGGGLALLGFFAWRKRRVAKEPMALAAA
jgi:hypothetical protein